jgi:7-cyano-7-deazaguanine synthase in queuosine biosynthesis
MFRFTQHDAKAIVILSEAKDLGNFPCARRLNIQRQSEMFRFAQHDRMARLFEN